MIEKWQTEIDAINVTIKMHSANKLQNAFHLYLHFALIILYDKEFQHASCCLPAWHQRRRQLQRFESISTMHSVVQLSSKTSSVFMSIHKRQQLKSCCSNHRLKPVLAVLDAKQRCENVWKITVRKLPHIASSARCTGHLDVFVCSLRIEVKKKS